MTFFILPALIDDVETFQRFPITFSCPEYSGVYGICVLQSMVAWAGAVLNTEMANVAGLSSWSLAYAASMSYWIDISPRTEEKYNASTSSLYSRWKAWQVIFVSWLSRLLKWRQGCEAVTRGSMKHFIPHGGVYVIHRRSGGSNALLVLNGTSRPATFRARRYAECVPPGTVAREVTSGRLYYISRDLRLHPRQTLVLEY